MVGEALYGTLEAKRETTLSARMHGHLIKVVFLGFGAVKSGKRCLYASAASAVHSRVYGACTAEAAASETSGLSVGERSWSILWAVPRLRRMYTGSRTTEVQ